MSDEIKIDGERVQWKSLSSLFPEEDSTELRARINSLAPVLEGKELVGFSPAEQRAVHLRLSEHRENSGCWHIDVISFQGGVLYAKRPIASWGVVGFLKLTEVEPDQFTWRLSVYVPAVSEEGRKELPKEIYFIQAGRNGPIKIGCSHTPKARKASLQLSSPYRLRLLGAFPGSLKEEHHLHIKFKRLRLHGEWFRPEPELTEFIFYINTPKWIARTLQQQLQNNNTESWPKTWRKLVALLSRETNKHGRSWQAALDLTHAVLKVPGKRKHSERDDGVVWVDESDE